jgi:hypothetical protein
MQHSNTHARTQPSTARVAAVRATSVEVALLFPAIAGLLLVLGLLLL